MLVFLQLTAGIVLTYLGAELLVRGSASLAFRLKISPLVVGLTIVAYGTSMPEMVVSMRTAMTHQGAISIGNVVGSNIFNIVVILGLSAIISPLRINIKLLRMDMPVMILTAFLFIVLFRDFILGFYEGLILFGSALIYTFVNFFLAKRAPSSDKRIMEEETGSTRQYRSVIIELLVIAAGVLVLIFGARNLVDASVKFARSVGISEAFIGLTIIAAGTSLPELATSVVAAFRKQADIAVGNVIGSNIFNILGILGLSSMLSPIHGAGIQRIDIILMTAVSILLFPLMWTKFTLHRWEGIILIMIYTGYIYYRIAAG